MKKFTAILTAMVLVLSLTACSSGTDSENSNPATSEATVSNEAETSAPETTTPATTTPAVTEPTQTEPAETTPAQTEPAETTPAQTKPAETTPAQTKPAETTPAQTKPAETTPAQTTPATTEAPEPDEEPETLSEGVVMLNSIYNLFGEDERFPVTGGDFSSGELIECAGDFSLAEPEAFDSVTGFPAAHIGSIDSAATMMHMMNANTFTSGAFHVVEGTDIDALNSAVRDNIQSRMWCCGFPEKLIVVNAGEYLICAFGKNFAIDAFSAHLLEAYPNAVIAIEEAIL